jgi:inosine-uridine nucleoside N-ribohydrolase
MKIMVTTALFSHMMIMVMVAPFTQMAIMVTSAPYIRPLLTQMIIMAAVPSSHTDNDQGGPFLTHGDHCCKFVLHVSKEYNI